MPHAPQRRYKLSHVRQSECMARRELGRRREFW
jgi:hypothetical protein